MPVGGPYYKFLSSGANSTGTSNIEGFFGNYSGLSLVGDDEVINIQIQASVNEFFVAPSGAGSVGIATGLKIFPTLSTIDLPPMRVGGASLMQVNRILGNAASAFNASYNWVVWQQIVGPAGL